LNKSLRLIILGTAVCAALVLVSNAAGAQTVCDPYGANCVQPKTQETIAPASTVSPATATVAPVSSKAEPLPVGQSLPLTGADIAGLSVLAAVLIGAGAFLVTASRRRERPVAS